MRKGCRMLSARAEPRARASLQIRAGSVLEVNVALRLSRLQFAASARDVAACVAHCSAPFNLLESFEVASHAIPQLFAHIPRFLP